MSDENEQDWQPRSRSGRQPEYGQAPQYEYEQAPQPEYGQAAQYGQQPQYGQPVQYGAAPQYGAPQYAQPPQPPKKKHTGRNVLFGILGVFVLIIVITVATSGGSKQNNAAAASPTTAAARTARNAVSSIGSASAPATSQAAQAPATTPAAASKTVVLQMSGSGIKTSKTFTVNSTDYSVAYTYDCSNFGTSGNFIADVQQSGNDLFDDSVANTIGDKGGDTTYLHDGPGSGVYISINSECAWTVTVTDGDNGQ